ncbi:RRP12-like protein [Liolophura sinensis]|uniref:RRP12-like protein n=1 Tax=Liolophura sinensis TaxID=3198878 RepID=UPI003159812A
MRKKGTLSHPKTSGKGKRWRKGQSSNSNPSGKKFRDAAKNRFFNEITGPSCLTEAALAKHNESQEDESGNKHMVDVLSETDKLSVTAKTMNSWASNWTECTNTSFGRVLRYCKSNSALHKEILAVLAAVTEIIKAQGGKESETEYLGALMTALDSADSEQSLAAVSYLISLVIKRVPVAVLRSRFSDLAKKLLDILGKHADGESASLLKSLLLSLGAVLRVQEQIVWNSSSTHQIYSSLLTFVLHPKPKVRKTAQRVVCVVLKGSMFLTQAESPPHHPAASLTAKYCVQQMEENAASVDCQTTLHILGLLQDILGTFPQQSLKSVCETILRLMTLSNVMLTACGMQALHGMFLSQPSPKSLPAELTAQIITALYEYEPSAGDVQPMRAWLALMEEGHVRLGQLQQTLCVGHLPRLVNACITCLLSQKTDVRNAATQVLKRVLSKCLAPAIESGGSLECSDISKTCLLKIQTALEKGLGYQYHATWGHVLEVFSVWYTVLGKQYWKIMTKSLQTMADLRETFKFPHKGEVDMAVGSAVRNMGPKTVLQIIPLNITGDSDNTDFPRSWLLPVLHGNIQNTELAYFTSYFLPLAAKFRTKAEELCRVGHSIQAKSYDALQLQIWSLLPQFCNKPTDLPTAFPALAKVLGMALNEREDLRGDIMLSLRKLILQNQEQEDSRAVLARFAKNYLPILLNLYTLEAEQTGDVSKPSVLETIKIYLQITNPELTNSLSSIDDLLRDTDSELEDEGNEDKEKMETRKAKEERKGDKAWLMEDNPSEIMDFLDVSTTKRLMASKPTTGKGKADKAEDAFKMTSDGRIIISADQDSDEGESEAEDDLQDLFDTFEASHKQKGKKRKLSIGDDDEDITSASKYKAGGRGIHRPLGAVGKSLGSKEGNVQKGLGQEYKAKKAGGDVQKKGQPDPYAYVPLQFSQLNRRKQAKLKGQFSGFVRGARKGAAKGRKAKQKLKH